VGVVLDHRDQHIHGAREMNGGGETGAEEGGGIGIGDRRWMSEEVDAQSLDGGVVTLGDVGEGEMRGCTVFDELRALGVLRGEDGV
jgi:hypothetical protein